jgi:hypothetical protein
MSGLLPLLKLFVDSGAVSPKAPTSKFFPFGKPKPKGVKQTDGPAFGKLGLKKFF